MMPASLLDEIRSSQDDYSSSRAFSRIRKHLCDSTGRSYSEFKQTLRPNYARVWFDIGFGYAMLIGSAALCAWMSGRGAPWWVVAPLGSLLVGYWIAYLQLFIHEGAHWLLAKEKTTSDRICDCLISWMIGTSVSQYRTIHGEHHIKLGEIDDSESTYFFPLNFVFFLESLFGVRVLKITRERRRRIDASRKSAGGSLPLICGAAIHLAIVTIAAWWGYYAAAAAWIGGVAMIFPLLGSVRQLLEHRRDSAGSTNYQTVPHGAFTRLFAKGPISSTFGGAGFNRHLLHHWEPQVSYTNLDELEDFLADTPMRDVMDRRRATYATVFLRLLSFSSR